MTNEELVKILQGELEMAMQGADIACVEIRRHEKERSVHILRVEQIKNAIDALTPQAHQTSKWDVLKNKQLQDLVDHNPTSPKKVFDWQKETPPVKEFTETFPPKFIGKSITDPVDLRGNV